MISSLIITICLINLIIVINIDNISKIINLYDLPDKKLKFHKKNSINRWVNPNFNVLFLILIELVFRIKVFIFFQSSSEIFSFFF